MEKTVQGITFEEHTSLLKLKEGCVSKEEYDALKAKHDALEKKFKSVVDQYNRIRVEHNGKDNSVISTVAAIPLLHYK